MRRPTIIKDKDFVIFFFLANSISIFTNIQYSRHFLSSSPLLCQNFLFLTAIHLTFYWGKKKEKHIHTRLRAFIEKQLKNIAFNNLKNHFLYFNNSFYNTPNIKSSILAYNTLK